VREGLGKPQKALPPKFFYDARGSQLFDEITELPEYYLTRTEIGIMQRYVGEMVARMGPHCLLVEYGSGSSIKTRILLDHLTSPAGYVPIDISREHLLQSAATLTSLYPGLTVIPVCADYSTEFNLPDTGGTRTLVYFPGSTVGNFEPDQARAFLRRIAGVVGPGGGLLIGVDLKKDVSVIEAAYNDAQGVTEAFNKNMLARINRELGGTFELDRFAHRAFYDAEHGRVEMHLVSLDDQRVRIGNVEIRFHEHETILTEYSYKYSLDDFAALASASFDIEQVWTDDRQLFSVQELIAR
ncbi:MAG: L-histidine N(alpha)-methyltransferase, partial [Bacteroidetes bacterium]|nr:L-histidine N(alpha)-methyltransferase [Bacteroidota bacterium]